jgi:hypothetical protein
MIEESRTLIVGGAIILLHSRSQANLGANGGGSFVMRLVNGLVSLTLGACLIAAGPVSAQLSTEYFSNDGVLGLVLDEAYFSAEGRVGDRGGLMMHELGLGHDPGSPAMTADFDWQSDASVPFSLTHDQGSGQVTFELGGNVLTYTTPYTDFDALFVRTFALPPLTFVGVYDLVLDGYAVPGASVETGPEGLTIMQIYGSPVRNGFVLTGTAKLRWTGDEPSGDDLAFQIYACRMAVVPAENDTWGGVKALFK